MKIGISINGVLRDYLKQIEDTHTKYFPPEEGEEGIKVLDYDLDKWITFPKEKVQQAEITFNPDFDPLDSKSRDSVEDLDLETKDEEITVHEFMYERCTLEIFGSAKETISNVMKVVNNLILEYPEHTFIIMSRELGLSIPATYFFLSKTSCMCQNVQFVTDSRDHWKYVDMMVTDHPDIISSKPEDKACVVVNKDFNQSNDADFRVETIKELSSILDLT